MLPEPITSAQNPKIKRLLALQKDSSLRREAGLFVVEGQRELEHCLSAGYAIDSLFIRSDLLRGGVYHPENFASLIPPTSWAPPVYGHGRPGLLTPLACSYTHIHTKSLFWRVCRE